MFEILESKSKRTYLLFIFVIHIYHIIHLHFKNSYEIKATGKLPNVFMNMFIQRKISSKMK